MKKNKVTIIILVSLVLLVLIYGIFYKIKSNIPKKISKNGAISLCKYIVYNKIDPSLSSYLKDVIYEEDNNIINIKLIFATDSTNNNPVKCNYTHAYCTFDSYYKEDKNILLKKFFYKDIKNKIYLYFNTLISIIIK